MMSVSVPEERRGGGLNLRRIMFVMFLAVLVWAFH